MLGRAEKWVQVKMTGLAAGEMVTTTDWSSEGDHILAGTNKVS